MLGFGWSTQGYSAFDIAPEDQGVGWLLAEGGRPRRFKAAYLTDNDIDYLVDQAAYLRRPHQHGTGSAGTGGAGELNGFDSLDGLGGGA